MKHLTTILIVALAALWSFGVRAEVVVKVGDTSTTCTKAADINALLEAAAADANITLTTISNTRLDGTINITKGNVIINSRPNPKSALGTTTAYLNPPQDSFAPLINITGGNVSFGKSSATYGGFRGTINIDGATANVSFSGDNVYYEKSVDVFKGNVTINSGTFGAYYSLSSSNAGLQVTNTSWSLMVADTGHADIKGGRFVTTSTQYSAVYVLPGTYTLPEDYELQSTSDHLPLYYHNGNHQFYKTDGSSAFADDISIGRIDWAAQVTDGADVTKYRSLAKAFEALTEINHHVTLTLLHEEVVDYPLTLESCDVAIEGQNWTVRASSEVEADSPLIYVGDGARVTLAPQGTGTLFLVNDYGPGLMAYGSAQVDFGVVRLSSAGVPISATEEAKVIVRSGTYTCTGANTPMFDITSPNVAIIGGQYVSTAHHVGDFPTASLFAGYTAFALVGDDTVELTCGDGTLRLPSGEAPTIVRIRNTGTKPFDVTTTDGTTTSYSDLALAYALLDPRTISSVTLTADGPVTRPINVVSDLTLTLGDYTLTTDMSSATLFTVKAGASLTVISTPNGGINALGSPGMRIFNAEEGCKQIKIVSPVSGSSGGHFKSTALTIDARNAQMLFIAGGNFYSRDANVILLPADAKNVFVATFVTDGVDESGQPRSAVISSSDYCLDPADGFFDLDTGVELPDVYGDSRFWDGTHAPRVKVTNVGARLSVTIGGKTTDYSDVKAAFKAATEAGDATVTLKRDILLISSSVYATKGHLTVNMGKYYMAACASGFVFNMNGDASLTINRTGTTDRGYSNQTGYYVMNYGTGTLTVNGGYFDGTNHTFLGIQAEGKSVFNNADVYGTDAAIFLNTNHQCSISGGRFRNDASSTLSAIHNQSTVNLPNGYALCDTGSGEVLRLDGVYYKTADGELAHDISLREAVPLVEVDIDGARTNYYSLAEAIAVASSTTTPASLKTLRDITLSAPIVITGGNISLATAGHTLAAAEAIGTEPLITVSGGSLSLVPALGSPAIITNAYGPAVKATDDATLTTSIAGIISSGGVLITGHGTALDATGNATVNILGGTFRNTAERGYAVKITTPNCTVSGGTFESVVYGAILLPDYNVLAHGKGFVDDVTREELCISFNTCPFNAAGNTPRTVSVADASLKATVTIDGVSTDYYHISEAWDAAQEAESGATIDLKDNAFIEGRYSMTKGDVTLNMGSFTLGAVHCGSSLLRASGGKLTVNAASVRPGGFRSSNTADYAWPIQVLAGGRIVVNGGHHYGPSMGIYVGTDGEAVITGGTFEGPGDFGLYSNGGHVSLFGGRFVGKLAASGVVPLPAGYAYYDISGGSPERLPDEQGVGGAPLLRADRTVATDVVVMCEEAALVVRTTSGVEKRVGDLAEAYLTLDPTTISSVVLLKDATVSSIIPVVSDLTLDLGSHTLTLADDVDGLFVVDAGGSLTVNANADGGIKALHSAALMLIHANGDVKRIAIHGGRYECMGPVLNASNAKELEITDGYFHSVKSFAAQFPVNSQKVIGGHFVTDVISEFSGSPYFAVLTGTDYLGADFGYFAPALDGSGEVELVEHSGPLTYWGGVVNASDVTIRRVGPRASVTIGSTTTDYGSIFDAFAAAQEAASATVTLKRDVLISSNCITLNKGNITLNMGEYTMAAERHGYVFQTAGDASLTINRTGLTNRGYPNQVSYFVGNIGDGTLTINGGQFEGITSAVLCAGGTTIINDGVFSGNTSGLYLGTDGAVCTLNGGRFIVTNDYYVPIQSTLRNTCTLGTGCRYYDDATDRELAGWKERNGYQGLVDASDNFVSSVYVAKAPATVTTLTHIIDDARKGQATLDDIRRAVDAALRR